ncbi:hypothetical protein BHL07_28400 [Bacillus cereus]|uniref:TnsD family Tn7-like transposition protein n=1 Tax=Bacillus cereus TaxID=1396 RepID=UPI0009952055|nr:TnsD family Tn7-like transposition protein [Bacillus cereus]OPA34609.1 hypothetical protein BHL07_28400 [Bacillus cereus]
MLPYFPSLYEDELIYSVFARYYNHIGSPSRKLSIRRKDLIPGKSWTISTDLPTSLNNIMKRLNIFAYPSVDSLIKRNTLYFYYTNFFGKEIKEKVWDVMCNGGNFNVISLIGTRVYTTIQNQYFKYCPCCVADDYEKFGETYWRLQHQIPSVFICERHETYLLDSTVVYKYSNTQYLEPPTIENCPIVRKEVAYSDRTKMYLKYITKESILLANNNYNFENVNQIYRTILTQKGYINKNDLLDRKKLLKDFLEFYGEELLILMNSTITDSANCWLIKLIRTHYTSFHPIRHILLTIFLGKSVKNLAENNEEKINLFGEGPYICLNKAAEHYNTRIIKTVEIKKFKDKIKGIFECNCGFSYSKLVPDHISDEKMYWKIEKYGNVWKGKLYELRYVEKLSLAHIASILDTSNTTVYYQLKDKLYLEDRQEELKHQNRRKYLELKEKHPDFLITHLKKINTNLIAWLYRNDKKWIMENKPNVKYRRDNNSRSYREVNWPKKDQEYLHKSRGILDKLYQIEPPIHVTKNRVAKELGIKGFTGYEKKTPKTVQYLQMHTEDREGYQLRKIKYIIPILINKGEKINKNNIRSYGSVKCFEFKNPEMQKEFIGLREKYNF